MSRPWRVPLSLLAAAVLCAGCGGDDKASQPVDRDLPAVTAPGTDIPYEAGGADGSGADGSEDPQDRGGVAAGPDTSEPGERPGADKEIKPPRGPSTEDPQ